MRARKVDPDELRRLYLDERMKLQDIAAHFDVHLSTITFNLTALDLPKRSVALAITNVTPKQSRLARLMLENGFGIGEVSIATGLTLAATKALAAMPENSPSRAGAPPAARRPIRREPKEAEPSEDQSPSHPFWTPERDRMVFNTKGSGQAVSELATTWGRPIAFVMQRWHRLRVAG